MARPRKEEAAKAAQQASEAARTLAQHKHQKEPEASTDYVEPAIAPGTMDKLRSQRTSVLAMEEIAAKREKANPQPESEEEAPKVEAKAEVPPVEAVTEVGKETPKTVRVKVDGEEFDADAAEVEAAGGVASYQKDKASEKRLKAAQEALAEAKKVHAESQRSTAQIAEWLAKQNQKPAEPKKSDAEFIAEKMDTIRFGTPQEAAAAMLEIQNRGRQAPPDQNQIISQAIAHMENKRAVEQFKKDFPEIVANPDLLKFARVLEAEAFNNAQRERRAVDWSSEYTTIGNRIKSLVTASTTSPQAGTKTTQSSTSSGSEKEARKASITNLPTASARAELPKEEKTLTLEQERQEALAELRRPRKQA